MFYSKLNKPKGSVIDQSKEVSKTRQSEQDSTDINKIMERFNRSGKLPAMQTKHPQYGDARSVPYDQALNIVKEAKEAFLKLPATTRKIFDNDPAQLEAFLMDDRNNQRAVELGLKDMVEPAPEVVLKEIAQNTKKEAAKADSK